MYSSFGAIAAQDHPHFESYKDLHLGHDQEISLCDF